MKYLQRVIIAAIVFFMMGHSMALADMDDGNLKGLNAFDVVVDIPATSCGPSKSDIKTSVLYVLSSSRIRYVARLFSPYIYVNVNILDDCSAADVSFGIDAETILAANRRHMGWTAVWGGETKGGLFAGRNEMSSRILAAVERYTKEFVVAWTSANPH
jgi:hypothetical protein